MLKVEDHQSAPAQPTHGYALSDMTDVAAAGPYVVDAARAKLVVRTYDINGNEKVSRRQQLSEIQKMIHTSDLICLKIKACVGGSNDLETLCKPADLARYVKFDGAESNHAGTTFGTRCAVQQAVGDSVRRRARCDDFSGRLCVRPNGYSAQ